MTARKLRILVVDDEVLTLRALQRILRAHDVTTAASGQQAIALHASQGPFDVILCDVMMPDVNGVDVYKTIAAQSPGQEERIVFVSGGVYGDEVIEFIDKVDNPLIAKPFDQRELLAKVAELADR